MSRDAPQYFNGKPAVHVEERPQPKGESFSGRIDQAVHGKGDEGEHDHQVVKPLFHQGASNAPGLYCPVHDDCGDK